MADEVRKLSGAGRGGRKGGERSGSIGSIEELWKRKREDMEGKEGIRKQEEWAFRGGKRLQRSPEKETIAGLEKEKRGWDVIKEEWMREMKRLLMEANEKLKEEMRGQGRVIREELENLKSQMREKEEVWEKEREEMKGKVEELEKKLEEMKLEMREKDEIRGGRRGRGRERKKG
ncbi:hypothetical protein RF55_5094 [Lasius niger]|uniref:Uncharacterized protein n=1 Tax=Lasius niger TaxID=67767 RepID=A0A0J7KWR6_LASNI|nr:hypothetical protein RF55_5094 [Lasius niger]